MGVFREDFLSEGLMEISQRKEEMELWAEGVASAKALWLDQFAFWQSRKLLGKSRVNDGEMDSEEAKESKGLDLRGLGG